MFWRRKIITAKSESPYGTDATPTVASNAILARNVRLSPLEQETDGRDNELNYVGHKGEIIAGGYVKLEFEVEVAGAGAAGSAAPYGALFKACGTSETLNAGVSAVYAPVAPGAETSASIYFYMGGRLHKLLGAIGDCSLSLSKGKVPLWKFSFMGLYTIPSDAALSAPTLTAFQKPVAVTNANTTPFTLHSYAGKFQELSWQAGNVLTYRNLVGSEAIRFTDRKSVGKVVLEDELVATKDWWTILRAGTVGTLSCKHGQTAGNIVTFAGSNVQLLNPSMDASDNIAMLSMDLAFTPSSSGNDEWSITIT